MKKDDISKDELSVLLDEEERKRRREAKRRKEEIIALMTEQETEMRLEYEGKLWGENSIQAMADEAYGGDGDKWSTDTEARVCADINPRAYGIEQDLTAQPLRQLILFEAWDIASKTITASWGEEGLRLFKVWLESSMAEICQELDQSAIGTMELIKSMVLACRCEVFSNGRASQFPFPEEEAEIRSLAKRLNQSRGLKRHEAGESQPADPENRVYLTPEEKAMSLDPFHKYLEEEKGIKTHRSQAARIKKRGWYHKKKYKPGGANVGQKVYLDWKDFELSGPELSQKYGIARTTANLAKKRGFFIINNSNIDNVKIPKNNS